MVSGSLRDLLNEVPVTEAELREVLSELDEAGPRGTAIIGATIVENALEDLILSRLRKDLTERELEK
jgi:hypothetical protein